MEIVTPDVLYHYCSIATFIKIMESRVIRLCDMCKSNDAMETKWLIRRANDIIIPIINSSSSHARRTQNRNPVVANPIVKLDTLLQNAMNKSQQLKEMLSRPITEVKKTISGTIDLKKEHS